MKRVRILLIDDSPTARAALRGALATDAALDVVGEAADGQQAGRLIERLSPDLITMDVFLRAENGLDVTASIMTAKATPIVVVTAADVRDPTLVFRAMQAGALDVCHKLPGPMHPDYERRRVHLIRLLKNLARVPVVHRVSPATRARLAVTEVARGASAATQRALGSTPFGLLALGASTGGPPVLARVLRALPKPFPLPIAVVQHMVSSFVPGFAKWLEQEGGHPVALVRDAQALERGVVHLPAADRHLVIEAGGRARATETGSHGFYRPSVDVLFEAVARSGSAPQTIAVLLTGMGTDGARGLLALRQAGAQTLVQEPSSCAVSSMPARAIALDAPELVVPADGLALAITAAVRRAAIMNLPQ